MKLEKDFISWVQRQKSCISGQFSEWVNGEGRCIACHVRRINRGSGIAHKPPFSMVPMTHAEHTLQHQKGETALRPQAWFENKADEYLTRWKKERAMGQF